MGATMFKRLFVATLLCLSGCGQGEDPKIVYEQPAPPPAVDAAFEKVKPLIAEACGKCHVTGSQAPRFDSAAAFKGSKALQEIEGGDMPPSGQIKPETKAALVAYLKS